MKNKYRTNIYYYDGKTFEKKFIKNVYLLNEFVYKRHEFVLVGGSHLYAVCGDNNGELISLWNCKKEDKNGDGYNAREAVELFRNEFDKNGITNDMYELFLNNPKKYEKTYSKKHEKKSAIKCSSKKLKDGTKK